MNQRYALNWCVTPVQCGRVRLHVRRHVRILRRNGCEPLSRKLGPCDPAKNLARQSLRADGIKVDLVVDVHEAAHTLLVRAFTPYRAPGQVVKPW